MIEENVWLREEDAKEQRKRREMYSNSPEFVNPDPIAVGTILPAGLETYIEEYKKTRDANYANLVMSMLSKLILKMLYQEVKRYKILRGVEMQELYHISFICMHHAMLRFDSKKSSIFSFPRFIQGYIQGALKKIVRDRGRLVCCGIEATSFENKDNHCYQNAERSKKSLIIRLSIEDAIEKLVGEEKIDKAELEMFKLRCIKGYSYKDIAKLSGKTEKGVECQIRRTVDKIRNKLKYFKKV
jgi:RNA polymerase sigma factor (sigma-70 family)